MVLEEQFHDKKYNLEAFIYILTKQIRLLRII
jgi:hypothetical protein